MAGSVDTVCKILLNERTEEEKNVEKCFCLAKSVTYKPNKFYGLCVCTTISHG